MSELTSEHHAILAILAVQSPGYDAFPNATCFAVEGHLDFHRVARILDDLAEQGLAVQYVYDVIVKTPRDVLEQLPAKKRLVHFVKGSEPDPVTEPVPGGFEITDAGRELAGRLSEENT